MRLTLESNFLTYNKEMSSYTCSLCNYKSETKGLVKKHIENVKKCEEAELIESIVKIPCEVCSKEFDTQKLLSIHRKKCVEKKALVSVSYANPESVENAMKILTNIVVELNTKVSNLLEYNEYLIKRIEKLEESKKESKEKRELEESDEYIGCETSNEISFIPNSYKQILDKYRENQVLDILKDNNYTVDLTVKGFRDQVIDGVVGKNSIEVDGKEYYYVKQRGNRCTEDLKIIITKQCLNEAKYVFNDKHYCDECV